MLRQVPARSHRVQTQCWLDPDQGVQWLAFIAHNGVPIYALALFIDLAFANSVEFWTGSNPVDGDASTQKLVRGPDGERMTLTWAGAARST